MCSSIAVQMPKIVQGATLIIKRYKEEVKDLLMHGQQTGSITECFIKTPPPPFCLASCTTFRHGSKHLGNQDHEQRFCNDHSQVTCLIVPSVCHFNLTCSINSYIGTDDGSDVRLMRTSNVHIAFCSLRYTLSACTWITEKEME